MIESQVAYVMDTLRVMKRRGEETVEVHPEAEAGSNARLGGRMEGTVWNAGCASWYLDDSGRNATLGPDWTFRFRRRAARFEPSDYLLSTNKDEREATAA